MLDPLELSALGSGHLRLTVSRPGSKRPVSASALLAPRFTCDVFDCVLAPPPDEEQEDDEEEETEEEGAIQSNSLEERRQDFPARGLAWITVDTSGTLSYKIKWEIYADSTLRGLDSTMLPFSLHRLESLPSSRLVSSLSVDNGRRSRRLRRVVAADLAEPVSVSPSSNTLWSNGSLTLGAVDLESLYNSDLYLNLATDDDQRALRGRIVLQGMGMYGNG